MAARFGEQVIIEYHDLFSPEMALFPEVVALVQQDKANVRLVLIGDKLLSAGGKVSAPAIRRALEALGLGAKPVE